MLNPWIYGVGIALLITGCGKEPDRPITKVPFVAAGLDGSTLPPRPSMFFPDMAGEDTAPPDAAVDALVADAGSDVSMVPDAQLPDAQLPDAQPPECTAAEDCTLAVDLSECQICPISVAQGTLSDADCLLEYLGPGFALFEYQPAACTGRCVGSPILCEAPAPEAICVDGRCATAPAE